MGVLKFAIRKVRYKTTYSPNTTDFRQFKTDEINIKKPVKMLVTFPIQNVDISMEGVTKWNG
jgi:hypothetical protein